jgi:signal recognition particle subunit SEC65
MITIWPQYLNKNLSLKEGRKIAKEYAVKDPELNDIQYNVLRSTLNTKSANFVDFTTL